MPAQFDHLLVWKYYGHFWLKTIKPNDNNANFLPNFFITYLVLSTLLASYFTRVVVATCPNLFRIHNLLEYKITIRSHRMFLSQCSTWGKRVHKYALFFGLNLVGHIDIYHRLDIFTIILGTVFLLLV